MSEMFDIGPLSWVKDEIDQSLKKVTDSYIVVAENPQNYGDLRFTLAHLYQVNGALDMVGLEGCKRYCGEIEKISAKIEKGAMPVTPTLMEDLMLAVQTLQQYLQDLLNGIPDTPIRLYDSLQHLAGLQGEAFEVTDLFFPDTSAPPPKDLPSNLMDESAVPMYVAEQRGTFQKSLLDWLMSKDENVSATALENMKNALFNVQSVQQKKSLKSLWWAASAFTEALAQERISSLTGAKKLCRKLDQQLRDMALGANKVVPNLMRDVLYYVAISDADTAYITQVKEVFSLDSALPQQGVTPQPIVVNNAIERAAIQQLLAELPALKELWVGVSEFVTDQDLAKETPFEELQGVAIKLELLLENMQDVGVQQQSAHHVHVVSLLDATHQVAGYLQSNIDTLNEFAVFEVASALNLLEMLAESYETLDAPMLEKIALQGNRLKGLIQTKMQTADNTEATPLMLDEGIIRAVAQQILGALTEVEKSVDSFFRNASLTTGLDAAVRPLNQVVAAFDMLEMPTPKAIARLSIFYVEQFKANAPQYATPHPNHEQFNLFAEALSLISLYAQDLPEVRLESKYALSECLKRLEEGMQFLDGFVESEEEVLTAVELKTTPTIDPQKTTVQQTEVEPANQFVDRSDEFVAIPHFSDEEITEKAIDTELQGIFVSEAQELLESNTLNLAALRENTNQLALTELRRAFHTLKGSGRTVGLEAMGEVAYAVERLLNLMMEQKASPNSDVLDFVEDVNQVFQSWVTRLVDEGYAVLSTGQYQLRAAELMAALEANAQNAQPKARKEEILIGGSRKVGRAFFYLFLGEAQTHLATLKEAKKNIKRGDMNLPTPASCRAAHTLSSNALTAGFEAIGDLARALEHWLDEFIGPWSEKHLDLYTKVIQALEEGLEKAKNLQNPKPTRSLIIELSKSTASMQVLAAQQAEDSQQSLKVKNKSKAEVTLSDVELLGSALSESEIDAVKTANVDALKPATEDVAANSGALETTSLIEVREDLSVLDDAILVVAEAGQPSRLDAPEIAKPEMTKIVLPLSPVDEELLGLFIEEAGELIPHIGSSLRSWKLSPLSETYPDEVQRALHTLKGSARTAGQALIGDRAHDLEDRVAKVLQHKPTLDDFDDIFIEFDRISFMLDDLVKAQFKATEDAEPASEIDSPVSTTHSLSQHQDNEQRINAEIATANELPQTHFVAENPLTQTPTELTTQFLRVRAAMLDKLINEAGEVSILRARMDREMQGFKQSSTDLTLSVGRLRTYLQELEVEAETQLQSRMNVIQEATAAFDPLEMDRFTRLQELTRLMAESLSDITTIQQGVVGHIDQTDTALQQQGRMSRELQKGLMTVRMMPFSSISERLHRIVRQISRELDKRVELLIEGEEIELDRSVLDKVGAPLEHLLRNAVAHGLETTVERAAAGKSPSGQIKLKVSVENDEITLTVSDDGRGVNLAKVKKIAIEKGLITENQVINDETLIAIIFESGFSTEESVSKIAGRGVGLDAVRSDIAALNGRIDVSNLAGAGAKFDIYLPVTLSVTQVVMVRIDEQQFAIPSVMVEQVQVLKQQELLAAYETNQIKWSGHDYPLHFLAKLIGQYDYNPKPQIYTPVALLRSGQYRAAIHVDEVIGNQEIVMKSMGTQLTRVPGIVGATVMGDGAIIFAINPVQLAHREALTVGAVRVTTFTPPEQVKKIALIVDDSLTMRKVLSRILEREGLEVVTANDGLDATQKLQELTPDIILTDIEMPRMDGFEFCWQLRETPKFAQTPIIMISSRTAQKHRTIADEIGVNAFLGKPVQDEELMQHVHALLSDKSENATEKTPVRDVN